MVKDILLKEAFLSEQHGGINNGLKRGTLCDLRFVVHAMFGDLL